ncbi:hypothetical protein LTR27_001131 [Elasticomyces elasticus]|nr:hypothetical protein LTR27_001131 [Elasticomyces elasticus]
MHRSPPTAADHKGRHPEASRPADTGSGHPRPPGLLHSDLRTSPPTAADEKPTNRQRQITKVGTEKPTNRPDEIVVTTAPEQAPRPTIPTSSTTTAVVTKTATPADMEKSDEEKAANVTNIYNNNDGRGTSGRDLVTVTLTAAMILFIAV